MIPVTEAKKIIIENCSALQPVLVELQYAYARILAEDIFSTVDIPNFPQSSMDGYAFNFEGYKQHDTLKIIGEMAAGEQRKFSLQPGEAVRIFTGAPVPAGADTVVMQEKTTTVNDTLIINDDLLKAGANVRPKGSEIKASTLALEKESVLTPAAIGFLAGIGIAAVKVYPSPTVSIIITGNELQQPGLPLAYGQVYESNSLTLITALKSLGVDNVNLFRAKDYPEEMTITLQQALSISDLVLITGGVSVGAYDFVLEAAEKCGIGKMFHRVKQKPGKPLFFGKKEGKIVFGLPGNPSSVLVCFYQYVLTALQQMKVIRSGLKNMIVKLAAPVNKPAGLTHFLKAFYDGATVTVLPAQESYRMNSFARSNCLVEIAESTTELKEGDTVKVWLLE